MSNIIHPGSIAKNREPVPEKFLASSKIQVALGQSSRVTIGDALGTYPGGKNGSGTYQKIINQQPPHLVFISAFLGHCGIMRNKRPADKNIGIDLDSSVIVKWNGMRSRMENFEFHNVDALQFIDNSKFSFEKTTLLYLDPPYLMETRTSGPLYQYEMSDDQHRNLLILLKKLPCMVQISGYSSELYDHLLTGWRKIEFDSMTRRGIRRECLWMNYPDPASLHTTSYYGENYRDREKIKRKMSRWKNKIVAMSTVERQIMMEILLEIDDKNIFSDIAS